MSNLSLDRDKTFIKIVERTCKRDAYQSALLWAKRADQETIIKFLQSKIDGHNEFLNSLTHEYDYGTQSLCERPTFAVEGES